MSGFNLRILAGQLIELEKRVAALEAYVEPLRFERDEPGDATGSKFTLAQRGRWWFCVSPEGVRLNETGLSKEDAQKLADDMNGATKEMVDA